MVFSFQIAKCGQWAGAPAHHPYRRSRPSWPLTRTRGAAVRRKTASVPCSSWAVHQLLRLCSVASKTLLHTGEPGADARRRPLTPQLWDARQEDALGRNTHPVDAGRENKSTKVCDGNIGGAESAEGRVSLL